MSDVRLCTAIAKMRPPMGVDISKERKWRAVNLQTRAVMGHRSFLQISDLSANLHCRRLTAGFDGRSTRAITFSITLVTIARP